MCIINNTIPIIYNNNEYSIENNLFDIEQIYILDNYIQLRNNDYYIEYSLLKILFALLFIIVLQYIF